MADDTIEDMLDNMRDYKSGNFEKNDSTRVQSPDNINELNNGIACPEVLIANISQDHWRLCKEGPDPSSKKDKYHTWTAIPGSLPSSLHSGSILIVRRTNRNSDGTSGDKNPGVMGIWAFCYEEEIKSNSDHSWNKSYSWYLHCTSIETKHDVAYTEPWGKLGITPQRMTGNALFSLNRSEEIRYLKGLIQDGSFKQTTKDYLQTLVECRYQ